MKRVFLIDFPDRENFMFNNREVAFAASTLFHMKKEMKLHMKMFFISFALLMNTLCSSPIYAECTKDSDCKGDRICVDGKCTQPSSPVTDQCTKDSDCKGDRICVDKKCVTPAPSSSSSKEFKGICGFAPKTASTELILGLASDKANTILYQICKAAGLENLPTIVPGPVPNAAAMIRGEQRYIVYNSQFIDDLQENAGTKWSTYFVVAHELGHHAEGHTITSDCAHSYELQSDAFAARALRRMGANVDQVTAAMKAMPAGASQCHPSSDDRVKRIETAYNEQAEQPNEKPKPVPPKKETSVDEKSSGGNEEASEEDGEVSEEDDQGAEENEDTSGEDEEESDTSEGECKSLFSLYEECYQQGHSLKSLDKCKNMGEELYRELVKDSGGAVGEAISNMVSGVCDDACREAVDGKKKSGYDEFKTDFCQ